MAESMTVAWPGYVHMDVHSYDTHTHRINNPKEPFETYCSVFKTLVALMQKNQFLNTFEPCASKLNIARGRLRAVTLLAGERAMVTLARPMPPICTALLRVRRL